jgi:hypothetical protein
MVINQQKRLKQLIFNLFTIATNNDLKNGTMYIHFKEKDLQIHRNDTASQNVSENQEKLGIKLGANEIEII